MHRTKIIRVNSYFPLDCCLTRERGGEIYIHMHLFLLETVTTRPNINIITTQERIVSLRIEYLVSFPFRFPIT